MSDPVKETRDMLAGVEKAEREWANWRTSGGDKSAARQRVLAARELAERAAPRLLKALCDELEAAREELRLRRELEEAREKQEATHKTWNDVSNKMDDHRVVTPDEIEALRDAESEARHADWAKQDEVKEARAALEAWKAAR